MRDYRIPLVFLEACQTGKAEQASESVASEMLKQGVVSVVAMSHSVLVATARRFVATFYQALAEGRRVGAAMLAGQRNLKDDSLRGHVFGKGPFRLQDWFVPVLFQEKHDPQLFARVPSAQTREDVAAMRKRRMGDVPPPFETGFIGRSRELLALQRLLVSDRYAVVRGQGGEGKTALAAEFARWSIRSQQVDRAAFVSVEQHSDAKAVLDAIGRQLVGKYSVAAFDDVEKAILPIERALREQRTLLVVDNMESVLMPPFVAAEAPKALSEESRRELEEILALCERLSAVGETRIVFTSREALPAPFDKSRNHIELARLAREDGIRQSGPKVGPNPWTHLRGNRHKPSVFRGAIPRIHGHGADLPAAGRLRSVARGLHSRPAMRSNLIVLGVALLLGCGSGKRSALQVTDGSAEAGGLAGTVGTGGVPGSGGTSGVAGSGGTGGTSRSTVNCAMTGCAMPPMCATGCTEICGCCPCTEGKWQGNLVCRGGCWAVPDAGVDADPAAGAFESFRLTQSHGPCPARYDCVTYIDLDKTGQLLRDPMSGPSAPFDSATVTPAELANAIAVFTDPALVKILDASSPPCVPPKDTFEAMKLVAGGVTHQNSTATCDNAPVKAARDLIYQLGNKYLLPPTP